MKIINNKIGFFLIKQKATFCKTIGVYIIIKNHSYIDHKKSISKIFEVLKNTEKCLITTTGVLICFYKDFIKKYPLGKYSKKALKTEFDNYLLLQKSIHKNLVNYKIIKLDDYYKMDKLYNNNRIKNYNEIIKQLQSNVNRFWNINELLNKNAFKNAFKIITNHLNKKEDLIKIITFLNKHQIIKNTINHGDLTQENIMQTQNGNVVIIDLDRFTFNGIYNLDRIHFIINYHSRKNNTVFTGVINTVLNQNITLKSYYLLLVYFLFRVGSEYHDNTKKFTLYYKNLKKTLDLLLVNNHFTSHYL